MLSGKNVVMGICGGIAVYKAVEVLRKLKKLSCEVDVIMTKNATEFVTPLTFQTLSKNIVVTDTFTMNGEFSVNHISLAKKADLILVIPATANIIGKVSGGISDDMLSTTIMAAKSPVLFAPSMNSAMYENSILKRNIKDLICQGYNFIEPEKGELACGDEGKGRLPEPETIVNEVIRILKPKIDFKGKKILITSGPTREYIDPARYISNPSSGKMGFSLARKAKERGAQVKVISGPVKIEIPCDIELEFVNTAVEMYNKVKSCYKKYDIVILTAAVSDYRCKKTSKSKIKKTKDEKSLELVKNPDIASFIGENKGKRIIIGFSAETEDIIKNSKKKLKEKNLDMIVANDINQEGAGFESDTNIVKIIKKDGKVIELPKLLKTEVSQFILDEVKKLMAYKEDK